MKNRSFLLWPLIVAATHLAGCAGVGSMLPHDPAPRFRADSVAEPLSQRHSPEAPAWQYSPVDGSRRGGEVVPASAQATQRSITQPQHFASVSADQPFLENKPQPYRDAAVRPASADFAAQPMPALDRPEPVDSDSSRSAQLTGPQQEVIQLNLPTALSMVGGQHPAVGFAQWRVQEAYAQLDRARVLWLPSIQPGFSFHKHDGNYQASDGSIVDVHRNSFQYGLGAGATGAGTTNPRPGIVAQFHLADAIFQPKIMEITSWARGHAVNGIVNEQLLNVAVAYLELLNAEQDLRIVEQTQALTSELAELTRDFAETGQGLQADADRLQTELILVEDRLASATA